MLRSRKRKRSAFEAESVSDSHDESESVKPRRRSVRIQERALLESADSDTLEKGDKWNEQEATTLIEDILEEYPDGLSRYKLLAQIQRRNGGEKWSVSYGPVIGEFNDFIKCSDKFHCFDVEKRNFSVMTTDRMQTILRCRHNLYESDSDTECHCKFQQNA